MREGASVLLSGRPILGTQTPVRGIRNAGA